MCLKQGISLKCWKFKAQKDKKCGPQNPTKGKYIYLFLYLYVYLDIDNKKKKYIYI